MKQANGEHLDSEARDILCFAGGAALIVLGAGLIMTHRAVRDNAKAALTAVMPDLEGPVKAGLRGILPDVQRYLKLRGM